jgi:hypothetical protein
VVGARCRRAGLEQQAHARAPRHQVDEARHLGRGAEHRQHQHLRAPGDQGVDLRARAGVDRVGAREARGALQGGAHRDDARGVVPRDARVEMPLALALAEDLDVGADPVDPGGVGARRQRRVVGEEDEREIAQLKR